MRGDGQVQAISDHSTMGYYFCVVAYRNWLKREIEFSHGGGAKL